MVRFKNVSDSADTALNVLFTSLGMILLVSIAFIYTYSNVRNPDILHIQCILSIIPLVPITNYMYRKLYKLTGSPPSLPQRSLRTWSLRRQPQEPISTSGLKDSRLPIWTACGTRSACCWPVLPACCSVGARCASWCWPGRETRTVR